MRLEDVSLEVWRELFAVASPALRALWPEDVAALSFDGSGMPASVPSRAQLARYLALTRLNLSPPQYEDHRLPPAGAGGLAVPTPALRAPTAAPSAVPASMLTSVLVDKRHALSTRLGVVDVLFRPDGLALPTEYLVAVALADLPDGRVLADPAAVTQWLASAGALLGQLYPSSRPLVEAGFRSGKLPSLSMFIPTPFAAGLDATPLLASELSDVSAAFALLRSLVASLYGPRNALDAAFRLLESAGSLRMYHGAFLAAGLTTSQAASAVIQAFDRASAGWYAQAASAAAAALREVRDAAVPGDPCADVARYIALPDFTLFFPLTPPPLTWLMPSVPPTGAGAHASTSAQQQRGPRKPRRVGQQRTPAADAPAAVGAPLPVTSSADVPVAIRTAITSKAFNTVNRLLAAHPDAKRLTHAPSGKVLCLRFALANEDSVHGCTQGATCPRHHMSF
jgi:hypothetical protein